MNFKKILFFSLLIAILAVSAVSAVENLTTDDLTVQVDESDIQEIPIQEDIQSVSDDDVLGQVMTGDEDNQNESDSCGEDVLGVKMSEDDVVIKANTKTIDAGNPNSRIVTVTLPKGEYG